MRNNLKWADWEMKNSQRDQLPRKWKGKGVEEERECDGRTVKTTCKEWEENGEQQQKIVGDLIENIMTEKLGKKNQRKR